MPYNPHPTAFRTRHWRGLYESHILGLSSLKSSANAGAIFVTIDAEPWGTDDTKPAEIGISLLLLLDRVDIYSEPSTLTLDAISYSHGLETHRIRITGRDRREKGREGHRYGQEQDLEDHQVEQAVTDIIKHFTQRYTEGRHQIPLILTGFSLRFEFHILSSFYPQLLSFFNSWVDLQDIVGEVSLKNDRLVLPSLHEALIACGFQDEALRSAKTLHNAATDSVRMASLLVYLLRSDEKQKLDIKCSSHKAHPRLYRKDPTAKKTWDRRPEPKQLFPFTAKVSRVTGFTHAQTAEFLLKLFAANRPVAAGLSKNKKHAWICLPSLGDLQEFIQQVDQSILDGDVWSAVSIYDPAVVPVQNLAELKSIQKRELHAQADEKRVQRKLKKENKLI